MHILIALSATSPSHFASSTNYKFPWGEVYQIPLITKPEEEQWLVAVIGLRDMQPIVDYFIPYS